MKMVILLLALLFPLGVNAYWEVGAPLKDTYEAGTDLTYSTLYSTSPTDFCVIGGSPGKVVKVYHARIWGSQTTGGINQFFLVKRSAYDGFSTNTPLVVTAHDSRSPQAGADVTILNAAPTLGTQIGVIRGADVFTAAPAGLSNSIFDFDFGPNTGVQPVILLPKEMLAVNFNKNPIPAGFNFFCEFNWTEE
jgi:hypothetical protein